MACLLNQGWIPKWRRDTHGLAAPAGTPCACQARTI
jgi:hypothetical protein